MLENTQGAGAAAPLSDTPADPSLNPNPTPGGADDKTLRDKDVPQGFHTHPAWQRILEERGAAETEVENLKKQLADKEAQISTIVKPEVKSEPKAEAKPTSDPFDTAFQAVTAELDPQDQALVKKLYPVMEKLVFTRAQQMTEAEEAEQKAKADAEADAKAKVQEEADKIIADIRTKFDSDESFTAFTTFINEQMAAKPLYERAFKTGAMTLEDFHDLFIEANPVPAKTVIAHAGNGGKDADKPEAINPNEDMRTVAQRELKKRGIT